MLNVRIIGPSSFVSTLNELKLYLKFNPLFDDLNENPSTILFHVDALQNINQKKYLDSKNSHL